MLPHHFQPFSLRQALAQCESLLGILTSEIQNPAGAVGRRRENDLRDRRGSGIVTPARIRRRHDLGQQIAIGIFTLCKGQRKRPAGEIGRYSARRDVFGTDTERREFERKRTP